MMKRILIGILIWAAIGAVLGGALSLVNSSVVEINPATQGGIVAIVIGVAIVMADTMKKPKDKKNGE